MKKAIFLAIIIATFSFSVNAQQGQVLIDPGQSITVTSNPCGSVKVPVLPINNRPPVNRVQQRPSTATNSFNTYVNINVGNVNNPPRPVRPLQVTNDDSYYFHHHDSDGWIVPFLLFLIALVITALLLFKNRNGVTSKTSEVNNEIAYDPNRAIDKAMAEAKTTGGKLEVDLDGGFIVSFTKAEDKKEA